MVCHKKKPCVYFLMSESKNIVEEIILCICMNVIIPSPRFDECLSAHSVEV